MRSTEEQKVVITSSGQQYIGIERDGWFYTREGIAFSSGAIATVIRREDSIFADDQNSKG
jgi:hypothetical protein